jgi:hypothetical protein
MGKLLVFVPGKRFRQDVSNLIVGRNISGDNCPRIEAAPHMMVANFDVFSCLVKDGVSSQRDGGLIIGI